jgi:predicted transcriptional regulator
MKKLIISMKSSDDMFSKFESTASKIKKGKSPKSTHYEISFESKKDFNKFVRNMHVLMAIQNYKPHSIYQLAKLIDKDLSNVKKVVAFFESIGALVIKEEKVSGRTVKKPVVDYQKVEFDLLAA